MKTIPGKRAVADDYLKLIRQFPLREIRSDRELQQAHAILKPLFMRNERSLTPGESDYLGALTVLVHDYEARRYPMPPDMHTPLRRLNYLIEQGGMKTVDLMKLLGVSQSLVSLILRGKRELTKAHVLKLADHFKLNPSYFL